MAGVGPGVWLAMRRESGNDLAAALTQAIGHVASVVDQSDAYAVLRVSGRRVREMLSKILPIDLHPRVFGIGRVAVTTAAHVGVTFWRLEDNPEGDAVFEIAAARSFTKSLWHTLCVSEQSI